MKLAEQDTQDRGPWWTLLASCGAALIILLGLALNLSIVRAADAELFTLSGRVTIDSINGTPASGAVVTALGAGRIVSATVTPNGSYSLALATGRWVVSVRPPLPSLASPTWVYSGTPQVVQLGNISNAPLTQTLNFVATSASATLEGQLTAPNGDTTFAAPNQAFIWAGNQEGQGNSVQVDPQTGRFLIRVLPGNTQVRLALENPSWAPPTTLAGTIIFIDAGQSETLTIQAVLKTASISGTVRTLVGNTPVAGIPVRAWRVDGSEVVNSTSDASGTYSLALLPGVWSVRTDPSARSGYVPAQPPLTVVLTNNESLTRTLLVATADITVEGRIVNEQGTQTLAGTSGYAYALYHDDQGQLPDRGPNTRITNGRFRLQLSSQVAISYSVRAFLDPESNVTAIAAAQLPNLTPGQTIAISIPAISDNSTISGIFRNKATGQPQTGIPGALFAASDNAGFARTRLNPATAGYSLTVASTAVGGKGGSTWYLRGFVDPSTGFVVQRPRRQAIFLPYNNGAGSSATADFTVAPLDSQIDGLVLLPDGRPARGARVVAREQVTASEVPFSRWILTDRNGRFRIRLTAGSYDLEAFIRRDGANDRLLAPATQVVTVSASQPASGIELRFRETTTTISGRITLDNNGQTALVRAYSASGASATAVAGRNGVYLLRVNSNDTWYLQAVAALTQTGTTTVMFYRSDRLEVVVGTGSETNKDLALKAVGQLPNAQAYSFDGRESQEISLPDGSLVQIPAGAMVTSGTVYLHASPLPELTSDGGVQPISFGYRLKAFDERGTPIRQFAAPVTLVLPFTSAQLQALGISAAQLVPQYWDEATWSWKPVEDAAVVVAADGSGTVSFQVDHFTDFAVLAEPATSQSTPTRTLFLPLTQR